MLYLLTKLIAKFSFFTVYRKVYILNEDKLPSDRATLITCNHPNGFVEPLVIGGYIPHKIHFLVRGDVFRKGWANFLLRGINCLPVFRFRDGFASMRKNNESFDEIEEILAAKSTLIVFAEGSTKQVRYVRPIQKGTIRLAFNTLENAPESNPCIVPAVIHFSDHEFFRSEVIMEYGTPINLADYAQLYETHKAKAIKSLMDDVHQAMQDLSISFDPEVPIADTDLVLEIARSQAREKDIFPVIQKLSTSVNRDIERNVGRTFSAMDDAARSIILERIKSLKSKLRGAGYSYHQFSNRTKSNLFNYVFLVLGFIPYLVGKIFNIIPIKFGKNYSRKKVKKLEFRAVIKLCSFLMFYPFYLLIIGLILGLLFSWKIGLLALFLPVLGWFTFVYEGQFLELKQNLNFSKSDQGVLNNEYQDIIAKLGLKPH